MRYRKLGRTNLEVSEIGFGGFAIGGVDYGPTDDRESIAAIERAFSLSQLAIGFALSHPDVSVVICGAKRPSQIEDNVAASEFMGKAIREGELQKARDLITAE